MSEYPAQVHVPGKMDRQFVDYRSLAAKPESGETEASFSPAAETTSAASWIVEQAVEAGSHDLGVVLFINGFVSEPMP